jgi:hypothetical protein
MSRALVILIALVSASCAGPTVVTGPYAHRLSPQDIHQIKAIVGPGFVFRGVSFRIFVSRPDHAVVDARLEPSVELPDDMWREHYDVTKRNGRWIPADPNQFVRVISVQKPVDTVADHL